MLYREEEFTTRSKKSKKQEKKESMGSSFAGKHLPNRPAR
jgi:hypothetical protein